MSGIGAHLPARRHQPASGQPLQQRARHHRELAQDRAVEAGIGQVKAERVLPADPGAHRLSGLTAGQILRHLEDRHQRQAARRPARLTPRPAGARELLIGQPLTQLVTHHHRQRALPLAPVHHRNGRDDLRRGLRPRPRLDRHHGLHLAAGTREKATAARSCRTQRGRSTVPGWTKSAARMLRACAIGNCFPAGPVRRGAGPVPAACRSCRTVEAAIGWPSFTSCFAPAGAPRSGCPSRCGSRAC